MTYVAAHMRDRDYEEIMCQLPDGADPSHAAIGCFAASPDHKYVVFLDGEPEVTFGTSPNTFAGNVVSLWMFGTDRTRPAVPIITNFFHAVIIPDLVKTGKTRCEVRALETNLDTIRWLLKVGLRDGGPLEAWGRNGEDFRLLYTTDEIWSRTKHWGFKSEKLVPYANGVVRPV
jgi:hypothetical protein